MKKEKEIKVLCREFLSVVPESFCQLAFIIFLFIINKDLITEYSCIISWEEEKKMKE